MSEFEIVDLRNQKSNTVFLNEEMFTEVNCRSDKLMVLQKTSNALLTS